MMKNVFDRPNPLHLGGTLQSLPLASLHSAKQCFLRQELVEKRFD